MNELAQKLYGIAYDTRDESSAEIIEQAAMTLEKLSTGDKRDVPGVFPLIHPNGTGKETLKEGYGNAYEALYQFIDAWGTVEFNARDYYPHDDPNAWPKAQKERQAANTHIRAVKDYIEAHLKAIGRQ